ncbi:MAG: Glu-tRNA(Gln) amidotransferase subunit GatE [Candidatus Heimdallarchaeota archaeon]|nr:Glu-tRNA(Gln) amidotransferase subunit GatE [Candidatus Heimdallarchaeota archaeon]
MVQYDYKQLGFKAGLEIHAQIDSQRKLFCNCKPELLSHTAEPDYHFERYFRSVLGELGDFDAGMLVEYEKQYRVIYETYGDNICTYEMDETPPFPPCEETMKKGFLLAKFLNCESPVSEIIFNRKQYLDGSITTGFQRTTIIARDGHIKLKNNHKIRINNVLIEEDAARRVNFVDRASRVVYFNLDRLGIPLTEIITNHLDCHDPHTLQEIGLILGLSIRVLGIGKRGIGTIRQDVNISITGGSRAELKGIQNIKDLPHYCDHEITRQLALIKIKNELVKRGVKTEDFQPNFIDVSSAVSNLEDGEVALAVRLPNCKEIFLEEVQPKKLFAEEVFDFVELIAGISMKKMTQQDTPASWLNSKRVREILNLQTQDNFIVIRGTQKPTIHALTRAIDRMKKSIIGVPEETRRINEKTFNSEFLRVIHGKDRMYSDTDTPPIAIDIDYPSLNKENILQPWEILDEFPITINELIYIEKQSFYKEFTSLIEQFPNSSRKLLGLVQRTSYYLRKHKLSKGSHDFQGILQDILANKISRDNLEPIIIQIQKTGEYNSKHYLQSENILDEKILQRIRVIIEDFETTEQGSPFYKLFRVVKTHFPMLTSEQITSALHKIGRKNTR